MKREIVFIIAFLFSTIMIAREETKEVTINGIKYQLTYHIDPDNSEIPIYATVVSSSEFNYAGNVLIPETVKANLMKNEPFALPPVHGEYEAEFKVKYIGDSAFKGCSELTTITLPSSLTTIDKEAFYGCSGLTSIDLPLGLMIIGRDAFTNCTGLTSIIIPASVCEIGGWGYYAETQVSQNNVSLGCNVFCGCSNLTSLVVEEDNKFFYSNGSNAILGKIRGDYFNSDFLIAGCKSTTIPEVVTEIGSYSFKGMTGITNISIPASIKRIYSGAFLECDNLKDYYVYSPLPPALMESGRDIEYLVDYVKDNVFGESIKNATLHVRDIDIETYKANESWNKFGKIVPIEKTTDFNLIYLVDGIEYKKVQYKYDDEIVPEECPEKEGYTFSGWNGLPSKMPGKDIYVKGTFIRNEVTLNSIVYWALNDKAVVLGNEDASGEVTISSSIQFNNKVLPVTDIMENAFNGCKDITIVTIPETITSIGERAIANIDKLTDVIIYVENVPETDRTTFENSYTDYVTLHVPCGSIEKYKETVPWKNFKEIVAIPGTEVIETYKLTYMVDGEVYKVVDVKEGETITPEETPTKDGYTFSGWNEIPKTMPGHDVIVTGSFMKIYNVGDLTSLLNYIMNRPGSEFSQLYDMNSDGELNIGDVILMIKKIHENQANTRVMARRAKSHYTTETDLSKFTAAQFVVNMAEGARVETIGLKGQNSFTHKLSYEPIGDGNYSVVVYSTTNQLLANEESGFIEVVFADDTKSEVTITDVLVSTHEGDCMWLESLLAGSTTGINSIENTNSFLIYDLKGNRLDVNRESVNSLPKGIYIMNGKKKVVK